MRNHSLRKLELKGFDCASSMRTVQALFIARFGHAAEVGAKCSTRNYGLIPSRRCGACDRGCCRDRRIRTTRPGSGCVTKAAMPGALCGQRQVTGPGRPGSAEGSARPRSGRALAQPGALLCLAATRGRVSKARPAHNAQSRPIPLAFPPNPRGSSAPRG